MRALTDYPLYSSAAALRECDVIAYDGDRFVTVLFDGRALDISWRHVFEAPGQHIRYATLARLPEIIRK